MNSYCGLTCQTCNTLDKIGICERKKMLSRSPSIPSDLGVVQGSASLGLLSQNVRHENSAYCLQHLPPIDFSYHSTEDQRRVPWIEVDNRPPIDWLCGAS